MARLARVLVRGCVDTDCLAGIPPVHHSVPVRFRTEDGGYEWLWVRRRNVRLCKETKK